MELKGGGGVGTGKQSCYIPKCRCDFCNKLAGPLNKVEFTKYGIPLDLCEDCFDQAMGEICNEAGPIFDKLRGK